MNISTEATTFSVTNTLYYPASQVIRDIVETLCYAGLTTLVCLIGVPTNAINCLVFWRQGLKDRMNLCLFSLAAVDFSFLTLTFTSQTISSCLRWLDSQLYTAYYSRVTIVFGGCVRGLWLTSGFVTMVISVERCVCVMYPHRASTLIRTRTIGTVLLMSALLFQCVYIMYPFIYRVYIVTRGTRVYAEVLSTRLYEEHATAFYMLEHAILGTLVPAATFGTVSAATAVTVVRLRAAMTWRERASTFPSDSVTRQRALTSTLVIINCVYIATTLPTVVRQVTMWFIRTILVNEATREHFKTSTAVVNWISLLNSGIQFFVYYRRSGKFRQELCRIFRSGKSQLQPALAPSTITTSTQH